ncbi:uncharacterized protein LOC130657029 isoform X2 [Hydractinia symbiolongicarpus]|nr:uncharacterized protein LOC130657029 isoform X2 [Hydractinia symbiolongicarpus]XP_057315967.1 uncharacterized protein LOC130657029 isoform X2 [Hydractinia symbiolongicarpus]XP_057315968.1 uncharacterized protein LOC130657029 isoform X2 [Hydractinia symbiolongicarpus]
MAGRFYNRLLLLVVVLIIICFFYQAECKSDTYFHSCLRGIVLIEYIYFKPYAEKNQTLTYTAILSHSSETKKFKCTVSKSDKLVKCDIRGFEPQFTFKYIVQQGNLVKYEEKGSIMLSTKCNCELDWMKYTRWEQTLQPEHNKAKFIFKTLLYSRNQVIMHYHKKQENNWHLNLNWKFKNGGITVTLDKLDVCATYELKATLLPRRCLKRQITTLNFTLRESYKTPVLNIHQCFLTGSTLKFKINIPDSGNVVVKHMYRIKNKNWVTVNKKGSFNKTTFYLNATGDVFIETSSCIACKCANKVYKCVTAARVLADKTEKKREKKTYLIRVSVTGIASGIGIFVIMAIAYIQSRRRRRISQLDMDPADIINPINQQRVFPEDNIYERIYDSTNTGRTTVEIAPELPERNLANFCRSRENSQLSDHYVYAGSFEENNEEENSVKTQKQIDNPFRTLKQKPDLENAGQYSRDAEIDDTFETLKQNSDMGDVEQYCGNAKIDDRVETLKQNSGMENVEQFRGNIETDNAVEALKQNSGMENVETDNVDEDIETTL